VGVLATRTSVTRALFLVVFAMFAGASSAAPTSVFMGPLRVGSGATPEMARLFEQKILTSARRHRAAFAIVSSADVEGMVDMEVARTASGCDGEPSCVTELASALDAPEIITGEVGRVGSTWMLSLTRSERTSLRVHMRVAREVRGAADGLFPLIDSAVDELLQSTPAVSPSTGPSPLAIGGGVGVGVGVVGIGVGVVCALLAQQVFSDADTALSTTTDADERSRIRSTAIESGQSLNAAALWSWIGGGAVAVAGAAALAVELVGGE
jgi:hypothetical protein